MENKVTKYWRRVLTYGDQAGGSKLIAPIVRYDITLVVCFNGGMLR